MPRFLEDKLASEARSKGMRGKRVARYIYGTLNNRGLMRGNKETAKGREADRKHRQDAATAKRTGSSIAQASAARRRKSRRSARRS